MAEGSGLLGECHEEDRKVRIGCQDRVAVCPGSYYCLGLGRDWRSFLSRVLDGGIRSFLSIFAVIAGCPFFLLVGGSYRWNMALSEKLNGGEIDEIGDDGNMVFGWQLKMMKLLKVGQLYSSHLTVEVRY